MPATLKRGPGCAARAVAKWSWERPYRRMDLPGNDRCSECSTAATDFQSYVGQAEKTKNTCSLWRPNHFRMFSGIPPAAQWLPFFWKGSFKLNQPRKDPMISHGHWAFESSCKGFLLAWFQCCFGAYLGCILLSSQGHLALTFFKRRPEGWVCSFCAKLVSSVEVFFYI